MSLLFENTRITRSIFQIFWEVHFCAKPFSKYVEVAQIKYVSRNQLNSKANLNFDLMCKKAKQNFQFS